MRTIRYARIQRTIGNLRVLLVYHTTSKHKLLRSE